MKNSYAGERGPALLDFSLHFSSVRKGLTYLRLLSLTGVVFVPLKGLKSLNLLGWRKGLTSLWSPYLPEAAFVFTLGYDRLSSLYTLFLRVFLSFRSGGDILWLTFACRVEVASMCSMWVYIDYNCVIEGICDYMFDDF